MPPVGSCKLHDCKPSVIYENIGKTPVKWTREEKRKDWSPNKRQHLKVQNAQWGAVREEIK
jgi:hypothetical protein